MSDNTSLKSRWNEYSPILISQTLLALLITFDYAFTNNLNHRLGSLFYLLIALTVVLLVLPLFKFYIYFKQRYIIIILHYLAISLFLIYFAPITGPYYFLLFFYIAVSMYWYGWLGYAAGLGLTIAITVLASMVQQSGADANMLYHVVGDFCILVISSLYIALLMLRKPITADAHFLRNSALFEHSRLISLINSMGDAVIATDKNGLITLYNGAALSLLNTNATLEDQSLDYFIKLIDEKDQPVNIIKLASKQHHMLTREDLHFMSNENSKVYVSVNISQVRSMPGRESQGEEGFIVVLRDITKQKNLDEERNEFISVTSHELRTPIATAEASVATAMRPPKDVKLPAQTTDLLEKAHNNIVFLGDLVNDLTTLDHAEHGDLDIKVEMIDPNALVAELAQTYQSQAKEVGLALQATTAKDINSLLSSKLYIQEILQNFISNALKYTKQGLVMLRVQEGKNGSVIFSVSDTGIGVSGTDRKRIFSKFYRSEDYRTRQTRGTGLGLYITVKLAKRIKGKIWFDSQLNKGSTFYLEVPPIGALNQDQSQVAQEEIKDFANSV